MAEIAPPVEIRPQPGPQTDFLSSRADIAVYGGAAGGGKSFGLLMDPLRYAGNPRFGFVIFRRTSPQITNEGGLWDEAKKLYPLVGAEGFSGISTWRFPSGAKGAFRHLQHSDTVLDWQGAQIAYIGFDELTHFEESQFFYMLSRNRSTSGVRPCIRATTNPAPGWVKRFLAPWLDKSFEPPAASGEIRWFIRREGEVVWVDEAYRDSDGQPPKSVTFIRSSVYDNKILLAANPEYLTNLKSLPPVEQARLLYGDWDVFDGTFFAEWSDAAHTEVPLYEPGKQPSNWTYFGGLDWGYGSPFAFVLLANDEAGRVHVLDECYARQLTTTAQAGLVTACLAKWGVSKTQCLIAADPRMFSRAKRADLIGEADIEAYWRAGLQCVEANDVRTHGWSQLREWLQRDGFFKVWKGYCSHLIETFPLMVYDKVKRNDMDTDGDDHLMDALRYALMTRPSPSPPKPKTPAEQEADWAEQTRQARLSQFVGHRQDSGQGWKV